ncbi:excisionase family DNA-binding protein [Microbacterium trichothecenolyticum]|uniref:Helix-turn-helix domain protein n=1 Tax=Microbacterium trichothecenolyticum TaxID=69370 RepID=A0A0M2HN11_MICTR|nr:excisionase family DNA-binding protein [Microbacterium trichothecenolyticum]KJL45825.1 Helix-turn-helix domain protein [Microbacterium trichothecenolyticum]
MTVQAVPREAAITAAELAAKLSCSLDTVYRLAEKGDLPGFRLGREWRFYPSVVDAHLTKPRDRWAQPKRSRVRKRVA